MPLWKHFIKYPTGFKAHIRLTKTHQLYFQFHEVFIPFIHGSALCPVTSLTAMFQLYPDSPESPAFFNPNGGEICSPTGFHSSPDTSKDHNDFTVEAFSFYFSLIIRRSSDTFSFNNNVAFEDIRLQGSWKRCYLYVFATHQCCTQSYFLFLNFATKHLTTFLGLGLEPSIST